MSEKSNSLSFDVAVRSCSKENIKQVRGGENEAVFMGVKLCTDA